MIQAGRTGQRGHCERGAVGRHEVHGRHDEERPGAAARRQRRQQRIGAQEAAPQVGR